MNNYTREDILRMVEEEDVGFIRLQFTDIFGTMKNIAITTSQLDKALNNEIMFDGSAIEGFARVEESDILSTLPVEIQKDIHKNRPEHPVTYGIITISEGKKRQIRRMMKSVHCCVIELKRISIGNIVLDESLRPGEWKEIFPDNA